MPTQGNFIYVKDKDTIGVLKNKECIIVYVAE